MVEAVPEGIIAAESVINKENAKKLFDFLKEQFALTPDVDFEGIYPLILSLYASGIPQGIYLFFHDLHVLERQVMNYIQSLGADVKTAENDLSLAGQELLRIFTLGAYGGGIQP